MIDPPEIIGPLALARIARLTQLVRILLRDRAAQHGQTGEDILRWSEDIKRFFEERLPSGDSDAYMSAVIDEFFNFLAAEVRGDQESR
jgi:hypothetical protein